MPSYPFQVQANLVLGILTIHNFIRRHQAPDDIFDMEVDPIDEETGIYEDEDLSDDPHSEGAALRDAIALNMWNDYQAYVSNG